MTIDPDLSVASFERLLIGIYALILLVTATFMPKTYIPDRWMIGSWIVFVVGFACALAGHFLGRLRCPRLRTVVHLGAAVCLILGLAGTVYFVSEGDDGDDEDRFVSIESAGYLPSSPCSVSFNS